MATPECPKVSGSLRRSPRSAGTRPKLAASATLWHPSRPTDARRGGRWAAANAGESSRPTTGSACSRSGVRVACPDPCICRRSCSLTSKPCDGGIVKCLIWDFDGALAHHRRVLRTLGDEFEALRRVIRTGRGEVKVPELCFNHDDQENQPKLSQPMPGRCLYVETKRNSGGDMASNTRIPKAELTGIYGAMIKRISRKMFGEVPEPVEVAWHNRKVLNFSFSIGRKAQKWDQCDENLKSFAHMAVASL